VKTETDEVSTKPTAQPPAPVPGIWRGKVTGALFELRISSVGMLVLWSHPNDDDGPFVPADLDGYELVEPGATWASWGQPPAQARRDDEAALLRLTEAALCGYTARMDMALSEVGYAGRLAAKAARAALKALREPEIPAGGE